MKTNLLKRTLLAIAAVFLMATSAVANPQQVGSFNSATIPALPTINAPIAAATTWSSVLTSEVAPGIIFSGLDFTHTGTLQFRSGANDQIDRSGGNPVVTSVQSFSGPIRVVMSLRSGGAGHDFTLTVSRDGVSQTADPVAATWVEREFVFDNAGEGQISWNWNWDAHPVANSGRMRLREVRVYDAATGGNLIGHVSTMNVTVPTRLIEIPAATVWSTLLDFPNVFDGLDFTHTGGAIRYRQSAAEQMDAMVSGITVTSTQDFQGPIRVVTSIRTGGAGERLQLTMSHGANNQSAIETNPAGVTNDWLNQTFEFDHTFNGPISFTWPRGSAGAEQMRLREIRVYELPGDDGTQAYLTALSIGGVNATIDAAARTASVLLPAGANLTDLPVVFGTSAEAVLTVDGTVRTATFPFTFTAEAAVNFTINSGDGLVERVYAVTVNLMSGDEPTLIGRFDSRPTTAATGVNTGVGTQWSSVLTGAISAGLDFTTAVPTGNNAIRWRSVYSEQLDANGAGRVTTSVQNFTGPIRVVMSVRTTNANNRVLEGELQVTHGGVERSTESFETADGEVPWVERSFDFDHTFEGPISFNWPWGPDGTTAPGRMRLREVRVYALPGGAIGTDAYLTSFVANGIVVEPGATMGTALPYAGTDLSDVEITFMTSLGATVRVDGVANPIPSPWRGDFTSARTFTVTSQDTEVVRQYVVTLTRTPVATGAELLTFTANGRPIAISPNMTLELPYGSDLANVMVGFTASQFATVTIGPNPVTPGVMDFTSPLTFTVTAQAGAPVNNFEVTLTVSTTAPDPIVHTPFHWHTLDPIPPSIAMSGDRTPDFDFDGLSRPMLAEAGDYFTIELAPANIARLVSTEFRWAARSNAVVVIEGSVDGNAWTEIVGSGAGSGRVANNSSSVTPNSTNCLVGTDGQANAIIVSTDGDVDRYVRFQSIVPPNTRFVRYRVYQQSNDAATFLVQAITITDRTHDFQAFSTNFAGLDPALTSVDLQPVPGGTVRPSGNNMINRPSNMNPHPCYQFSTEHVSSVRFGSDGNFVEIALDNPVTLPGELALTLLAQTTHSINVRLQFSTDGENWTIFNDTAWVMAQATPQMMFFDFPTPSAPIRYFRVSRNATPGGIASQTYFLMNFAINLTGVDASVEPGLPVVREEELVVFYPNPATDVLHVTANNIREIEVINMMGQVVLSVRATGNHHTLDVSSLASGLHFIRVTTDTGISVGRFIKQ